MAKHGKKFTAAAAQVQDRPYSIEEAIPLIQKVKYAKFDETVELSMRLGVVTNDIFTREDAEFLTRHEALPTPQIRAVETGGCPHAAIREDISPNLMALEDLMAAVKPELLLVESGGDNLAAQYSRELVDYTIYVIDVAGGDKVPRKGGPGITQSDLLVINKTDLAPHVGADLSVMDRDAKRMRGAGPTVFAQVTRGVGIDEIVGHVVAARALALGQR